MGTRINERIRAREVRVIDEVGGQLGVLDPRDALAMARERGLDLIEVAPNANPPVCRIMDYGKYKYDQAKKEKDTHKKQKGGGVKGVWLRPATDEHDFNFKLKNAIKFLQEGDKVKITVRFRSREITHPEFAKKLLDRMVEEAAAHANVEKAPAMEGRTMTMILSPKS